MWLNLDNGKDIYKYEVKNNEFISIDIKKTEKYKCSIHFYDENGNIFYKKYLNDVIIGADKFNYNGYEYNIINNEISFKLDIDEFCEDIMYAFYVLKDNQPIKKFWYTKNKEFKYKIDEEGKYKIQFFIKIGNNQPVIGVSEEIRS